MYESVADITIQVADEPEARVTGEDALHERGLSGAANLTRSA